MASVLRVLLLVAAVVWQPCLSRDLVQTVQLLNEKVSHQRLLESEPDLKDEIHEAVETLKEIWTELNNDKSLFSNISRECVNSTRSVLTHTIELPVFKMVVPEILPMLDATGKLGAGFFRGDDSISGSFDECLDLNYTSFCSVRAQLLPQLNLTLQLCVPRHCSEKDMSYLINTFTILKVANADISCTDTKFPGYGAGTIVMISVCFVFALLVLTGTLVNIFLDGIMSYSAENHRDYVLINDPNTSSTSQNFTPNVSEKFPLLRASQVEVKEGRSVSPLDFILAFSLVKTVSTLLATKQAPSVITSLNGLRVISMFWVILGHTFVWSFTVGLNNSLDLLMAARRFSFQAIGNAYFSVDSFFFLSGTLVAYLTLRETKKRNGRFPILHYYIHRYLRLTPTYAFVLFFTWFLTQHLTTTTLTMSNPYGPGCSKYWWTNLFYINNLYPWSLNDECIGWSWYLANDMQFYIIAPLILIPAYFLFPLGLGIAVAILFAGFVVTATLAGVYDFPANTYATIAYGYIPNPNITANYMDLIYVKPWSRISPYLVGLILGYMLYRGMKIPFNRIVRSVLYLVVWIASGVILMASLYGLYFTWHGHIPSTFENIVYITFSRFAWGVGLALLVFACHNGYGWYINSFLSMPIWTPLSRMTYNAYLLHPVVLTVIFVEFEGAIHYSDITMALIAIGAIVLSYGAAAVACVCVEFPLGTIETLIFKLVGLQGRKTQ